MAQSRPSQALSVLCCRPARGLPTSADGLACIITPLHHTEYRDRACCCRATLAVTPSLIYSASRSSSSASPAIGDFGSRCPAAQEFRWPTITPADTPGALDSPHKHRDILEGVSNVHDQPRHKGRAVLADLSQTMETQQPVHKQAKVVVLDADRRCLVSSPHSRIYAHAWAAHPFTEQQHKVQRYKSSMYLVPLPCQRRSRPITTPQDPASYDDGAALVCHPETALERKTGSPGPLGPGPRKACAS